MRTRELSKKIRRVIIIKQNYPIWYKVIHKDLGIPLSKAQNVKKFAKDETVKNLLGKGKINERSLWRLVKKKSHKMSKKLKVDLGQSRAMVSVHALSCTQRRTMNNMKIKKKPTVKKILKKELLLFSGQTTSLLRQFSENGKKTFFTKNILLR